MTPLRDGRKAYVNKAVASQGLNLLDPSHIIREFQARELNNATPTLGGFKSRYGYEVYNEDTAKTGGITMLHGFNKSDGTKQLVFAHDDNYYHLPLGAAKDDAWSSIGDYGTVSTKISAYTFADNVIFGTGIKGNKMKKWDGTTFSDITTPASRVTVSDTTIAFVDSNPDTITDSNNGLANFQVGDVLEVSGSASNDGTYTIATVSAGTITLDAGDSLSAEGAGASVTLTANRDLSFYEFFQGQDFAALFGAGDPQNPSTLYYSQSDDPDVWSGGTAGAIDIAINDGFKITGLKAQGNQLIVYKEKNRYYISTFYESNTGVYGLKVSPFKDNAGGAITHETIHVIDNGDIVALASQSLGVQGIGKQQAPDGSLLPKEYSRDIRPLFEQINWSIADLSRGIVYDDIVWLAVPFGKSATTNNYVFRYHIDRDAWDVIPNLAIACWEVFFDEDNNEVLYAGSADTAKIYKFNKNVFTDNGQKINTVFESGLINLGSVFDVEAMETVALKGFKQQGDELKLTITIDGVETTYKIDDTFIITNPDAGGYLSIDTLSSAYISSGGDASGNAEWMAIVLIPGSQSLGRETKIRLENTTKAAEWGCHWLSINEINATQAKRLPPKYIIVNQSS